MSKPSWDDAPEKANFRAQDADGEYWWYQNRPVPGETGMWVFPNMKMGLCWYTGVTGDKPDDFAATLEARP